MMKTSFTRLAMLIMFFVVCGFHAGSTASAQNLEASRNLAFANQMLKNGMAGSAAAHFRGFINENPNHPRIDEARWGLAQAYETLEDSRAVEAYRHYAENHPRGAKALEAQFALARSLYRMGNWSEARAAFSQFSLRHPESALLGDAYYYEGLCLVRMERYLEAIPVFEKAAGKAEGNLKAEASFSAASAYYRAKRFAEAAEALYVVARSYPGTQAAAKADGLLGDIFFSEGDFSRARNHYAKALETELSYSDKIAFWHAYCAVKLGSLASGVNELIAFAERYPGSERASQALRIAAEHAEQIDDNKTSINARKSLLNLPDLSRDEKATGLYELGSAYMRSGDLQLAEAILLQLIREDSRYQPDAEYLLGLVAVKEKDYATAESYLRSAEELSRGTDLEVNVIVARLNLLKTIDNPREYARLVERLKELDVSVMAGVLYHGAELLEADGKPQEAAAEYKKIIDQFPGSLEAVSSLYALGMIHYSQADYVNAEDYFLKFSSEAQSISSMTRFLDDALYWVGFSRYQRREMEQAITAFMSAAEAPDGDKHGAALLRAGDAAFTLKRYEDAFSYYSDLISGSNSDSKIIYDAMFNRAITLRTLGKLTEARSEYLRTFAEGGTAYEEALLKAAECLQDEGKIAEAAIEYEAIAARFQALGRKEESLFRAAALRREIGEKSRAIELFRAASSIQGALAPDASFHEAKLFIELGDTTAALAAFASTSEKYPETIWGRRAALEIAKIKGSDGMARELWAIIDKNPGDQVASSALLQLGILAKNRGEYDTAAEFIKRAMEKMPEDESLAVAKFHLGRIYFEQKDFRQAQRQLEYIYYSPLYKMTPIHDKAAILMAETLAARGNRTEALNLLTEISDSNSDGSLKAEIEEILARIAAGAS